MVLHTGRTPSNTVHRIESVKEMPIRQLTLVEIFSNFDILFENVANAKCVASSKMEIRLLLGWEKRWKKVWCSKTSWLHAWLCMNIKLGRLRNKNKV